MKVLTACISLYVAVTLLVAGLASGYLIRQRNHRAPVATVSHCLFYHIGWKPCQDYIQGLKT